MKFMLHATAIVAMGVLLFSSSCKKDESTGNPVPKDSIVVPKTLIDFSDLSLNTDSFWSGSDNSGGFTSGNAKFKNTYAITDYGVSWSGFAYSNKHNLTTAGTGNQYSAFVSETASNIFALAYFYDSANIVFTKPMTDVSLKVTNNTYAALSMKNSDQFGKKFGGASGNDKDSLVIIITGYKAGISKGKTQVFLADFTSSDNSKDYILDFWKKVDLSSFGAVDIISFKLVSSDNSNGFMNTPSYFCLDDIEGKITE